MRKRILILTILIVSMFSLLSCVYADITEVQGNDVAEFAKKFIEEGNARRDEKGFPLLTYGLTGSWSKNVAIRTSGYNAQMTDMSRNGYYIVNGRYVNLGYKWVMDCGTTVLFLLKNTLGFELLNKYGEPWHVQDIYNDAARGKKSQYFDMIYKNVRVGSINYSKLKKGDVIAYLTSDGNHGMLYLGDGYIAHANRDMIKSTGNNKISGFQVNKLNRYFLPGTRVNIMRIKDGIIPEDLVVNGVVTWPDTGETVDLLERPVIEPEPEIPIEEQNATQIAEETEPLLVVTDLREKAKQDIVNRLKSNSTSNPEFNGIIFGRFQMLWEQYVKLQSKEQKNVS